MNIALFAPSEDKLSETFIREHRDRLKDRVFFYAGTGLSTTVNGQSIVSKWSLRMERLKSLITGRTISDTKRRFVQRSLIQNHIEVILVEFGTHSNVLMPVLKDCETPLVTHFHGYDASAYEAYEKSDNYREVFNRSTFVVVVSQVMRKMIIEAGCPEEKVVLNHYGPRELFHSIRPSYDQQLFVAAGRFTDKKAPYYTILAFKQVLEKYPEARLIMAGNGELLNSCKNLVHHFGMQSNVSFPGRFDEEQLTAYFGSALGFVQHSIRAENGDMEGTPVVIIEASASGLPVISTIHAGIPDVIKHQTTGLLGEEHDVDKMTSHMLWLLDNPEEARIMGENGRAHIKEKFSIDRHISVLQRILEKAVDSVPPSDKDDR